MSKKIYYSADDESITGTITFDYDSEFEFTKLNLENFELDE